MSEPRLNSIQSFKRPRATRKTTRIGQPVYQPSSFHFEFLSLKKERKSSAPDQPSPSASKSTNANPWAVFQLRPNRELKYKQKSCHERDRLPNELTFYQQQANQNDATDDSLDGMFEEIQSPESLSVNIPKLFVPNENNILSVNVISIGELRPLDKNTLGIKNKSFEEIQRVGQSISDISGAVPASSTSNPESHNLDNLRKRSSEQSETKDSSQLQTVRRKSNFWREAFSPFLFKKKAANQIEKENKDQSPQKEGTANDLEEPQLPRNINLQGFALPLTKFNLRYLKMRILAKKFGRTIYRVGFILLGAIIISTFSCLLTYSSKNTIVFLWVDEFFNGFLLIAALIVFVRFMIKINFQKDKALEQLQAQAKTSTTTSPKTLKSRLCLYKPNCIDIVTGFVILTSSLVMVAISAALLPYLSNPFMFLVKSVIVFILDAFIITQVLNARNKYLRKQAIKRRGKGFFEVPIYKDFMQDISSTRAVLEVNKSPQISYSGSVFGVDQFLKQYQNENLVYRPEYEVITVKRIVSSQLILFILYLQFIGTTAFCFLQKGLEEDLSPLVILVILTHPFAGYIFKKICELLNKKADLSIDLYLNYVNILIVTIFSRITFFFIQEFKFVYLTIAIKVAYKIIIFMLQKKEIDALDTNLPQNLDKSSKERVESIISNPETEKSAERGGRRDTILQLKFEKLEEERRTNRQKIMKKFVLSFVLTELSDSIFSLGSIYLVICYRFVNSSYFLSSLSETRYENYLTATGIETIFNYVVLGSLAWYLIRKDKFKGIKEVKIIKPFFSDHMVNFCVINVLFFFYFLNITQIFDERSLL